MHTNGRGRHRTRGDGELVPGRDRIVLAARALVRDHPIATIGAAGLAGIVLGGAIFSRLARLVFVAAAGYVANELWHREGRLDVDELIERLSSRRTEEG